MFSRESGARAGWCLSCCVCATRLAGDPMSADLNARWKALIGAGRVELHDMQGAAFGPQGARLLGYFDGGWHFALREVGSVEVQDWGKREADLPAPVWADAGTLGVLLGVVRERWGDPHMHASYHRGGVNCWRVWRPGHPVAYGTTEAHALLAALEASPTKEAPCGS